MAYEFNSQLLTVADGAGLDITATGTIACWFWADQWFGSVNNTILKKDGNYIIRVEGFGKWEHIYWDGTNVYKTAANAVPGASAWHHVALIISGNNISTFYVDGVDKAEAGAFWFAGGRTLTNTMTIGAGPGPSDVLDGRVCELGVWNGTALGAADVAALAKGYSPLMVSPAGLTFYAPLVRDLIDVCGGLAITNSAATVIEHPRIIMPRRRLKLRSTGGATSAPGSAAGVGTATATGASTVARAGSAAGAGVALATATAIKTIAGTAAGAGAATAVGASTRAGAGSSTGVGTAQATATAIKTTAGTAAGTGVASGVGAATAAGVGNATGQGLASGVSPTTATIAGAGVAAGASSVAGVGVAIVARVGNAAGAGAAVGVGAGLTTAAGAASAAGTSTALAIGAASAAGKGTAAGTSAATAAAIKVGAGVGFAAGTATALAAGTSKTAGIHIRYAVEARKDPAPHVIAAKSAPLEFIAQQTRTMTVVGSAAQSRNASR